MDSVADAVANTRRLAQIRLALSVRRRQGRNSPGAAGLLGNLEHKGGELSESDQLLFVTAAM